jgi:hypothetical protein
MTRPRAADDFATIRARMKELRLERGRAEAAESELEGNPATRRTRTDRWPPSEISGGPGLVRQSSSIRG